MRERASRRLMSAVERVSARQRLFTALMFPLAAQFGCGADEAGNSGGLSGRSRTPMAANSNAGQAAGLDPNAAHGGSGVAMPALAATPLPIGGQVGSLPLPIDAGVTGSDAADGGEPGLPDPATPAAVGGAASAYPILDQAMFGRPVDLGLRLTPALALAEGPLWDPCSHQLLFSDVEASLIYALGADLGTGAAIEIFAADTGNANGLAWDIDGSLILAQMGRSGHLGRLDRSGVISMIEPLGGPALHTPDDVTVRSDGTIYFSDGEFQPIGSLTYGALPIYSLAPNGNVLVNGGSVRGPNGIEFSPDEKTLYVAAYFEGSVVKFAVAPDGTLTKGDAFARGLSYPDSLCLDAAGNMYVAVKTGLQVLRADGTKVTLLDATSSSGTTNCAFGGDDGKTLYITAWTKIYKLENMPIPGLDWQVNRARLGCM
jgi:gluconolactonase